MTDSTTTVSEKKLVANRANAARSTGPKTVEGKARSRMNALKHGLRAEEVVLPGEDAAAFEAERAAFFDEWQPPTATRAVLVERLATDAWRLRRCVRVEGARLHRIAGEAAKAFDDEVHAEVDEACRLMTEEPARSVDRLLRLRPGCDLLRFGWEKLAAVLNLEGEWRDPNCHHNAFCRLMGLDPRTSPAELGDVAIASWTLTITNNPGLADRLPWDDRDGELSRAYPTARAEKMRGLLLEMAEREARRLAEHHDRLPDLEPSRRRQVEERCFDPTKEGLALQRYESRLDRSFRANLNQLIRLGRTGEDLAPADEQDAPIEPTAGPVGGPDSAGTEAPAPIEPTPEPEAPIEATESGPGGEVSQAARDRRGRTWPVDRAAGGPVVPSRPPSNL